MWTLEMRIKTWCLVRRLRIARVFLGRRSRGKNFLLLYASLSANFCFWEMTVNTWAIDFLTTLLKDQSKYYK